MPHLLDRLLYRFGYVRIRQPILYLEEEMVWMLASLSSSTQRDIEQTAHELLHTAVTNRLADATYLQLWQELTRREKQTAALVCLGFTNQEIAERMIISVNTVKTHIRSIFSKFGINSKNELQAILSGWDFTEWSEEESGIHYLDSPPGASS
jgi:DNA-binding CsgD family transcriptional regulator